MLLHNIKTKQPSQSTTLNINSKHALESSHDLTVRKGKRNIQFKEMEDVTKITHYKILNFTAVEKHDGKKNLQNPLTSNIP